VRLAVIGHLSRDVIAGGPPRIGGPPWHAARALRALGAEARIVAKCGEAEAVDYGRALESLGLPFDLAVGARTTSFSFTYDEHGTRTMSVDAVGDPWREEELRLDGVEWLLIGPVLRGEIEASAVARGRHVLLDGHGLVRRPETGPLQLDGDFDRRMLDGVEMLKLSDEEAEIAGSVDVPEVIVTHGTRGATVAGVHVPAGPAAGDPTGAGDMFAAAYLVARSERAKPVEAARRASAVVTELLQ